MMSILDALNTSLTLIIEQIKINAHDLYWVVGVIWGIYFLTVISQYKLLYLGIIPRKIYGLPGIVFSPFLHGNFNHLFFNTIPLVVLSNFVLINGLDYYLYVTAVITLISGFLTWCFAKPGIHVGASGVITGYWALLVSNIYQQGTLTAIILGIVCLYYFMGIFYGMFPGKKGVSWEGHLFGAIAGGLVSYWKLGAYLIKPGLSA